MGRRVLAWVAALCVGGAACRSDSVQSGWNHEADYRWRALNVRGGNAGFTRMPSRRTSVRFRNAVSDSSLQRNRVLAQGAGVALGDVDGDGLVDVFLGRTEGCSALYRNLGEWRFEDVTRAAGVGACDRATTGVTFADLDGDRDLDLVLVATTGRNAVFVNDGGGKFTERRDLGLDTAGRGATTIAMADTDGDGDLELYVANYNPFAIEDSIPPAERSFADVVRQTGPNRYEITPRFRDHYKLVLRPDMGGLRVTTRAEPDDFYENDGGQFKRVALTSSRFRGADSNALSEEPESFGLTARFADLDLDGAPELYVANDFEDTDELWFNDGQGRFTRAGWAAQRQMSNASMGVDVADINGDALPDFVVVDMLGKDRRHLATQIPTHTALPKQVGDTRTVLQHQRNTLFVNRGDRTFAEIAALAGVQASGWSWSSMFMDVDLDGWQDLLVTTGHLWDIMDGDVYDRLDRGTRPSNWQRLRWEFPPLPLRNVAFRNRGNSTFEDVSTRWDFGAEADVSHAMASADLDGDGDLDVVVNRLGAEALLLRNDAAAPRVAVRLVGNAPNTFAVGARIRVTAAGLPTQSREVTAGGLYLSHSDYLAAFGTGTGDSVALVVDWRNGTRTTVTGVRPNRLVEIVQPASAQSRRPGAPARRVPPPSDSAPMGIFVDASAELQGHAHVETPYNDTAVQGLLPNSLAHLGPGVAWLDCDADGDDDLVIGAGRGGSLAMFRNSGRRLSAAPLNARTDADMTGLVALPFRDGMTLLSGIATWERPDAVGAAPGLRQIHLTDCMPVSGGPAGPDLRPDASTGPLALGDYDRDGDLDLFVGGRAIPGEYPRATSSTLLRNDDGRFVEDPDHSSVLRSIGLVSAAVFADIDGDADADLVLAREWESLLLLRNDAGRLRPDRSGLQSTLARWTSRWNGIATGDVDGDGRLDLVATSWGRNTMAPVDSAHPLELFHGRFGVGGRYEMLLARRDGNDGALPLNSYSSLRTAIPSLSARVPSFAAYGDATIDDVLGPARRHAQHATVTTLDHMVFLNRGDHLEVRPLPLEAQYAPAFYVGVADFTGDGHEDVFLGQNFSSTAPGLPRYDSGRGLLLAGSGTGEFAAMSAARSGIVLYGDQRGAAYSDIDADGRLDLVISQNAGESVLLRNRGGKPGLRVRLSGPANNPDGIGAQIRVVFGSRSSPVREVQAGSGYWSQNGTVQVFGLAGVPTAVQVRWPGGAVSNTTVAPGTREVNVRP